MGFFQNVANTVTGTLGQSAYNQEANAVKAPDANNYQISGLNSYTQGQAALGTQTAGLQQSGSADAFNSATGGTQAQEGALGQYLQAVAMGQQPTAADQLLQNSQGQAARQLQAGVTSSQGLSPALAMRQLYAQQATQQGNLAGQAAQQKLSEQQQYAGLAQANSQALYNQQFQTVQQGYQNQMSNIQAQGALATSIFNANAQQTSYNTQLQAAQTAYQTYQAQIQFQSQQAQASATAQLIHSALAAAATVGSAAATIATGGAAAPLLVASTAGLAGSLGQGQNGSSSSKSNPTAQQNTPGGSSQVGYNGTTGGYTTPGGGMGY